MQKITVWIFAEMPLQLLLLLTPSVPQLKKLAALTFQLRARQKDWT